ncbi:MAG: tRNA (uridine(34)/cytosine(34)/5-carboxymethylaminomethyluridine(34)-2'-O)-methyltransferase TrmL [Deltaproteobacteria bacterium]|nr:tRNA (uridine(34)/cytosine(34)/5-carboxymethylaminomethyluridine(34)-2'-O)-methyltransferase TrmL [Deltaproteobacteria bacterium]
MNIKGVPMHIVLLEPEIPPNTGNIARLCAATGSVLHLVGKLGFSTDDRYLKRAGLDYWEFVDVRYHKDMPELYNEAGEARFFYLSSKVERPYTRASFKRGDYLVFGKETAGLPKEMIEANMERAITIPMYSKKVRSLNLSTAVGIVLYEALRQVDGF